MRQKINKNRLKPEYSCVTIIFYCNLCHYFVGKDNLGEDSIFQNYDQSNDYL